MSEETLSNTNMNKDEFIENPPTPPLSSSSSANSSSHDTHNNDDGSDVAEEINPSSPPTDTTQDDGHEGEKNKDSDDDANIVKCNKSSFYGVPYQEYHICDKGLRVASFSPDGSLFLTGGQNKKAHLIECGTGRIRHTFERDGTVLCGVFSSDGGRVIIGGYDNKAIVYNVIDGNIIETLERDDGVFAVAYSSDGKYLVVGGNDQKAVLYDASSYQELHTFNGVASVYAAVFSPDSSLLAIGGGYQRAGYSIVFDTESRQEIQSFERDDAFDTLAISSDNSQIIVGGYDKKAVLYELHSGKTLHTFERSDRSHLITSVSFDSTNDRIAIGYGDSKFGDDGGLLEVVDASTYQTLYRFHHHDREVRDVSFSRDDKRLIYGAGGKVFIYDVFHGQHHFYLHHKYVRKSRLSRDGSLILTALRDDNDDVKTAILQDTVTGDEIRRFTMDETICDMCISGDGKKVIFGYEDSYSGGGAKLFDVFTGKVIHDFPQLNDLFVVVSISNNDELFLAGGKYDKKLCLYNATTKEEEVIALDFGVEAVAFSNNSKRFIVGGDKRAVIYSVEGTKVTEITTINTNNRVTSFSFNSDDQQLLVGESNGNVSLRDSKNGDILKSFQQNGPIHSTGFITNNMFYASGRGDRIFTVRSTDTPDVQYTFLSPSEITNISIAQNTTTETSLLALITTRNGTYIVPIYNFGPSSCFLPVDDFLQQENIDSKSLKQANHDTSGLIQLQRGSNGITLLHGLAQKDKHNELADLITPFPDKVFASRSTHQETTSILKCLAQHHHLETLQLIIESASFDPSTASQHYHALTDLMKEFVNLGNIFMAVTLANISSNGFNMLGYDTFLQSKDDKPLSIQSYKSSSIWKDRQIWNPLYSQDKEKRICHETGMVAIPSLAGFDTLSRILSLQSNDIFQCPSVQTTIMSHWDGWAKKYFLIQSIVYIVWLFGLFWISEISRNDRLHDISITSSSTSMDEEYDDDWQNDAWYYSNGMKYAMLILVFTGIVLFSFVEYKQATVMTLKKYARNGWNIRQVIALLLATIFTITSQVPGVSPKFVASLAGVTIFMNFFGVLYYMRVSNGFAWIVYTLLRILSGLKYFIIVTGAIIVTYAATYRAMYWGPTPADEYEDGTSDFKTFSKAFETIFFAGLFADFNSIVLSEISSEWLSWLFMVTLIVFVTVVALNALIAYSGDIFDRILEERTAVLIRIKAECIMDLYCLLPRKMKDSIEKKYMWTYRLIPPGKSCGDELDLTGSGEDNGSGGDKRKEDNPMFRRANKMDVKELREDIDEMKKQHDEKLDKMKSDMITEMKKESDDKLDKMKKESDDKLDKMQKKTDDRFDNLEKKIDLLLAQFVES